MEIYRKQYVQKLLSWKDKHLIKIITGVRRCGKSWILKQFREQMGKSKINIISYDFNDDRLSKLSEEEVHEMIIKRAKKGVINYVFLDEIQEIHNFERAVISLFEHKKYKFDLYLTGSNSKMFSSHMATLFTGRNIEVKVYPLSFQEFMVFATQHERLKHENKYTIFDSYLTFGGMPMILEQYDDKKQLIEVLNSILHGIVDKDIKGRHAIKTLPEFMRLLTYSLEHTGNTFSTRSLSNYVKSANRSKTSHKTIEKHLLWMCEALLLYKTDFYDAKGKKTLEWSSKYYAVDTGIRNAQNRFSITNRGSLLENIVFIELLRRGYDVKVGKLRGNKEIDFVAIKQKELIYIQVADRLDTPKIKDREYGNLKSIKDSYKKMVITEDRVDFVDHTGIETINIVDWLLNYKI